MKLALGTVQFGLNYGITNKDGLVSKDEVDKILTLAQCNNLYTLDTAAAYGDSELVLGELANNEFQVISKIPSFSGSHDSVEKSVYKTLKRLNRESIYGLMLHDENDIKNIKQYDELSNLKKDKVVDKIGCSFYTLEALEFALDKNIQLDIIQIPASCLDQRFEKSGLLVRAKEKGIEVHCRSLFLQGLLLSRDILPLKLIKYKSEIDSFFKFSELNAITPMDLALSYIYQSKYIDYGVVGCQSKLQLEQIISSYRNIEKKQLSLPLKQLASSSELLLNPSLWN
jgi:aryl-alcohol dehydrogenase-like predicted oxidoreductase